MITKICPLCHSENIKKNVFIKNKVNISCGVLNNTENSDKTNICNITLDRCEDCGFIFNSSFDLKKIQEQYKSSSYFLKKNVSESMIKKLNNVRDILLEFLDTDKKVIEVGSGDGALSIALSPFVKEIYSIDPSINKENFKNYKNIIYINNFYNRDTVNNILKEKVDMIIFRHLLEHIDTPFEFLEDIMMSVKDKGYIYIEVPNFEEITENARFYDIFHDHFGYYTKNVLENKMESIGVKLLKTYYFHKNQHIGLIFQKDKIDKINTFKPDTNIHFTFDQKISNLNNIINNYKNIAIYGAGAHGNSILNYLTDDNLQKIKICFDKDKNKQNKYLQNSNIKIQEPSNIHNLDLIIIASALYEDEICNDLINNYKVKCDILKTSNKLEVNKHEN